MHTVRGSGPSRNFDLSIPFPSFRLAFYLWSTPSRSRVCHPPDPNLLLRLYHTVETKTNAEKIKIGSAMQRRAIYNSTISALYVITVLSHRGVFPCQLRTPLEIYQHKLLPSTPLSALLSLLLHDLSCCSNPTVPNDFFSAGFSAVSTLAATDDAAAER